ALSCHSRCRMPAVMTPSCHGRCRMSAVSRNSAVPGGPAVARAPTVPRGMPETPRPTPIILDCDPGTDDALALMLAFASPELDVLAVTVAGGNVGLAH